MSKELVTILVSTPRERENSFGVLVDLVFNENGLNTSASNLKWFPKSLCSIEKVEPIDIKKNLPTFFLTAPKWLVEKNLKK